MCKYKYRTNKTNKNQCTLEKKVSLSYKRLVFYYIQKNKIKSKKYLFCVCFY